MLIDFNLIISLFAIYKYIKSTHYPPNFIQDYVSIIVDRWTTGSWVADTLPPIPPQCAYCYICLKNKGTDECLTQGQEAENILNGIKTQTWILLIAHIVISNRTQTFSHT